MWKLCLRSSLFMRTNLHAQRAPKLSNQALPILKWDFYDRDKRLKVFRVCRSLPIYLFYMADPLAILVARSRSLNANRRGMHAYVGMVSTTRLYRLYPAATSSCRSLSKLWPSSSGRTMRWMLLIRDLSHNGSIFQALLNRTQGRPHQKRVPW